MDPYQVLGVSRDADEETIKRAYKKLALKWHPDKNMDNREEAERRFKKIGEAMNILGDKNKREMFDRFGTTDDTPTRAHHHHEMSPDEIFQMFFGPGFQAHAGRGGGFYYEFGGPRMRRTRQQTQQEDTHINSPLSQLLPLLPLLFIFLLSFSGSESRPKADFMLHRTSEFYYPRYTRNLDVMYYVNSEFDAKFTDTKSMTAVEKRIENEYKQLLHKRCQSEKVQQRRLSELVEVDDPVCNRECRQEKAEAFELESCEKLRHKFGVAV